MKEFNIRILKADNGWVICENRVEGEVPKMRVVHEDCDLAGEVAAALVSDKLEGRTIQGYNNIESIERALVKLAKYERDEKDLMRGQMNAAVGSAFRNWGATATPSTQHQQIEPLYNTILKQQYNAALNAINPNYITKIDNTPT